MIKCECSTFDESWRGAFTNLMRECVNCESWGGSQLTFEVRVHPDQDSQMSILSGGREVDSQLTFGGTLEL